MDWNDITLKDYEELMNVYKTDKSRFANSAIEYLFNIKNADKTLSMIEYSFYLNELRFFSTEPPKVKMKSKYMLNGKRYDVNLSIQYFSAVQFQDYTVYSRQPNPSTIDLLSVVLIPHGKKYNDGYDIEEAKNDIAGMNVSDALAVVFFFAEWFQRYVQYLKDCLTKQKRMRYYPEEVKELMRTYVGTVGEILMV